MAENESEVVLGDSSLSKSQTQNARRVTKNSPLLSRLEERAHNAAVRRNSAATSLPCAFGSGADRFTPAIGAPSIPDAPDPGIYPVYESSFSNGVQQPHAGLPPIMQYPSQSANGLWSRSSLPRLSESVGSGSTVGARNLGPTAYEQHKSKDNIYNSGSVWLDTVHCSSSFATKTKRFEQAGVEILEIPDSKYTIETEAKHWTSKGVPKQKAARFRKKDVHTEKAGFLTLPSIAPGYIYNTDCPHLPCIASGLKEDSNNSSAIFKDKCERFPDAKMQYARPLGPDTYSGAWFRAIKV